jgi:hypothetical protein
MPYIDLVLFFLSHRSIVYHRTVKMKLKMSIDCVGTLKTGYPRIQILSQDKEQDVHPRAAM